MRRLFALALAAAALVAAQSLGSLSGWQFFRDISGGPESGVATLTLDAEILAASRDDDGDLRVIDAAGKEVPYDLHVLLGERNVETYEASEVGRGVEGDAAQITLDLGPNPAEHDQVQVDTQGTRFRRQVAVFGSDDAQQWTPLIENGMILRLTGNGNTASINQVPYPVSEHRYVRVDIARDPQADEEPPVIESAVVQRVTVIPGEEQQVAAESVTRETIIQGERSASQYTISLPGRTPLHGLLFRTSLDSFARTYQLVSILGDNIAPLPISVGRISRREGEPSGVVMLRFPETFARQLQLTVIDGGEDPIDIVEPAVLLASRRLVVNLDAASAQPLRLYYGNPKASAPDYGLDVELSGESAPHLEVGPQQPNPVYEAPQAPFSQQWPWLIYVLTGAASLALLAILRSLVFDVAS
jgi:hypothetical protein